MGVDLGTDLPRLSRECGVALFFSDPFRLLSHSLADSYWAGFDRDDFAGLASRLVDEREPAPRAAPASASAFSFA